MNGELILQSFLSEVRQVLSLCVDFPSVDHLIVVESNLIRVFCPNRLARLLVIQKFHELNVNAKTNYSLSTEDISESRAIPEKTTKSSGQLDTFLGKLRELESRSQHSINIKHLPDNVVQVWVGDVYMAQHVVNLCRGLGGCEIGVRIMYGGSSDRPQSIYDDFEPGFFLGK